MKKEAILLLTLLIFSTSIYADCDVTSTFNEGESKAFTAGGKDYNITFSDYKNDSTGMTAKFSVDGKSTSYLGVGQKHSFDDLSDLRVNSISPASVSGNNTAQICFNGGLVGYGKGTCTSSKECEDNNPCTIDECDGDPLRCHHKLILWCRNDDGCCQRSRCTEQNDNDCKIIEKPINDSVKKNETLINETPIDETPSINETPIPIKTIECESGDDYCPENCNSASDADCGECVNDSDCDDNNACTSDICSGYPKKCSNIASPGCDFNKECVAVGNRTENQFCGTDNTIKPLKSKKESCDNNYECLSNYCTKNKCKHLSFFKKIINWFVFRII